MTSLHHFGYIEISVLPIGCVKVSSNDFNGFSSDVGALIVYLNAKPHSNCCMTKENDICRRLSIRIS